jgi:signal transduction histidine kinase
MFNSHVTLTEVVCPVPICRQEVNRERLLNLIRGSKGEAIAIVNQEQLPIGIIYYRSLLPLLAESFLNQLKKSNQAKRGEANRFGLEKPNLVTLPPPPFGEQVLELNSTDSEQVVDCWESYSQNWDLNALIEPIVTVPIDMSIDEFLSYFKAQIKANKSLPSYLAIDSDGRVLGLLDTQGLMRWWLLNEQDLETKNYPQSSLQEIYFRFLEKIPLPLMLQTAEGEILYQNPCWQEQISTVQEQTRKTTSLLTNQPQSQLAIRKAEKTSCCLQDDHRSVSHLAISSSIGRSSQSKELSDRSSAFPLERKTIVSPRQQETIKRSPELPLQQIEMEAKLNSPSLNVDEQFNSTSSVETLTSSTSLSNSSNYYFNLQSWRELKTNERAKFEADLDNNWQYFKIPLNLIFEERSLFSDLNKSDWLVLAINNTQQKQARKNSELIQLNQLKDEFFAAISHELKSPLTAIVGLSSLLKEQKLGNLNQRQIRYAELIHRSGRQLMSIVNNLLDLSRLATGKLKLNLEKVKIKTICEEAYQQAITNRRNNQDSDVFSNLEPEFQLTIESGLEIVIVDKLRLRQLISHLLDNALKFTPADGKIGISVSLWRKWIAIVVWDTGKGIPEASQHLILEQFTQSETTSTQGSREFGLMLAQQLAKAHGGDISFISQVDRGTEFTVLLPAHSADFTKSKEIIDKKNLATILPPITESSSKVESLTILRLYPEAEAMRISATNNAREDLILNDRLYSLNHRVLEADSLEQGDILAKIWQLDALILDGSELKEPWQYLRSLQAYGSLAALPLVILDAQTTEAANQIDGLSVFPCLISHNQKDLANVIQVIKIAAGIMNQEQK